MFTMLGESLRTGTDDKRTAKGRARAKAQWYNESPENSHFDRSLLPQYSIGNKFIKVDHDFIENHGLFNALNFDARFTD
ncbi:hypothetical protein [Peribacillus phoenicis]|uniref:hypothetical protein n=1 Tax=unclassified Peribacillus TaxID=2675266 RepID=UPI0039A25D21